VFYKWSGLRKVAGFIEGNKRKEIIWGTKLPLHFNGIKNHEAMEELAKE
jgi:hypothetical protein